MRRITSKIRDSVGSAESFADHRGKVFISSAVSNDHDSTKEGFKSEGGKRKEKES